MEQKQDYFLVESKVLPEIFLKVMEVKRILAMGRVGSVHDAVHMVGISRSSYYKYKDSIFSFYETSRGKVVTLFFGVADTPGILSEVLKVIAESGSNLLTIHQSFPIHGLAEITATVETRNAVMGIRNLLNQITMLDGVEKCEVLATG